MNFEIIGYIAAILTTSAYLPQAYKIWKSKDTKSISFRMYLIMFLGIFLWLVYSIEIKSPSMLLANSLSLIIISMILYLKIKSNQ